MATVDGNDDDVDRFVVWHYRFDRERHERRNVVVAAFDNEGEFLADIERRSAKLQLEKRSGAAEAVERISGVYLAAGSGARNRAGRTTGKETMARGRPLRDDS